MATQPRKGLCFGTTTCTFRLIAPSSTAISGKTRADAGRTDGKGGCNVPSTIKLVGRAAELKELEQELRRASQGEFRCVLLSADAGIGKTRLIAELLARHRRHTVGLAARAYALGRMAPFGLWAEALDRHLRDLPAEQVSAACGGLLEDLAGLLRGVAAIHGSIPSEEVPRFRLFEALAVLVKNLAAKAPVIIALDDLHDADGTSWEVLNYLAHNLSEARVLVVGAVRPGELSNQPIGIDVILGLEQEGMLRRLGLAPLSPDGVGELTELVLHRQAPASLVTWLTERSQGNPLFALSLLLALIDEGADLSAPTLRHVPEELAERVTSRISKLEEPAITMLEMLETALALVEIAGRIDRDLYRALADLGSAWADLATGSEADAVRRAESAVSVFAQLGYRAFEGRALHTLGRALAALNRNDSAVETFERAVEIFDACGAAWRVQRCREALRRLGNLGRRAAAASLGPTSLSRREREEARLAAQGLTARQIAGQLFIGQRTVESHLASVYAKLGVESKLDLVRHAPELTI